MALSLVYFYSHYFFASNTAHITSMYPPFLAVAIAVGTPPMLAAPGGNCSGSGEDKLTRKEIKGVGFN